MTNFRADDWKISGFGKLKCAWGHAYKTTAFMGINVLMTHTHNGRIQRDKGMHSECFHTHFN